jgi:hypothetical protein
MAFSAPCCVLAPVPPRLTGSVPVEMSDALIGIACADVTRPFMSTVTCGTDELEPNVPVFVPIEGTSTPYVVFFVTAGLPWFTMNTSESETDSVDGRLEIFTSGITSRCIACSSAALVPLGAAPCQ